MPSSPQNTSALTTRFGGRASEILIELGVAEAQPADVTAVQIHQTVGVWDTGASASVITESLVTALGLKPVGVRHVSTANGVVTRPTYMVDLYLPNDVRVSVEASSMKDVLGAQVLIGMDVITLGDFVITNRDGKTVFTFRTPSLVEIDYVQEAREAHVAQIMGAHGRNGVITVRNRATGEEETGKVKNLLHRLRDGWVVTSAGKK